MIVCIKILSFLTSFLESMLFFRQQTSYNYQHCISIGILAQPCFCILLYGLGGRPLAFPHYNLQCNVM